MNHPHEKETQWFCNIDGEILGPLTNNDLLSCIQEGAITANTLIKKGGNGEWTKAEDVREIFSDAISKSDHSSESTVFVASDILSNIDARRATLGASETSKNTKPRIQTRQNSGISFSFLYEFPIQLISLLADKLSFLRHLFKLWIIIPLVVVFFICFFASSYLSTKYYNSIALEKYEDVWIELQRLRHQDTTNDQWEEFKSSNLSIIKNINDSLQESTKVNDPISMDLLRAGRDYLPKMLDDARENVSRSEIQFEALLNRIHKQQRKYPSERNPSNGFNMKLSTILIILFDAALVGVVLFVFFRRKTF